MTRIAALDPAQAQGKTKDTLGSVEKLLGGVPNLFRVTAQAPAALEALVGLIGATAKSSLSPRTREAIALVVAESNGCDYCLSAHTALGAKAGLTADEMSAARDAASSDPKRAALLRFAQALVHERGRISAAELAAARGHGVTDAEALETIAVVVANLFTNYVNLVADTEIDFPVVRACRLPAAAE